MNSFRLPPTFMPTTPSSQPLITLPAPSRNSNGLLRSWLESNFLSSFASQPAWCTETVSPRLASLPSPTLRSSYSTPERSFTFSPLPPPPSLQPPGPRNASDSTPTPIKTSNGQYLFSTVGTSASRPALCYNSHSD